MVIYLDLVVLLNSAVDFLLLLGTNRLSGYPPGTFRCALGGLLGGFYSGLSLLPGLSFLGSFLWRGMILVVMGLTAFGATRGAWKRCCVFLILSMAMGGIAISIGRGSVSGLLLCAGVQLLLCHFAFPEGLGRRFRELKLCWMGKSVTATALVDTGNHLRDPVTGEPVVVLSAQLARKLTGLREAQLRDPLSTLAAAPIPGLRLIPYRAVGSGGMLLGLKIPQAQVDGENKSLLVAFAPEGLGNGDMYHALTGGAI